MNINQTIDGKALSWRNLPDTINLLQYLCRRDLIELSKCCKRYRKQLEPQILEKLNLYTWKDNNSEIYGKLRDRNKLNEILEFLKIDLGSKLSYVKKFALNCDVNCEFAEIFINLLPKINALSLFAGGEYVCCLGEGLTAILKGLKGLEHVDFFEIDDTISNYTTDKEIFPKSLKSFDIRLHDIPAHSEDELGFYNTIGAGYTNLYSLTIVTDIMLHNLSCGMPNLQEVHIKNINELDTSKLETFLKNNPQLKKLTTSKSWFHDDEKFKVILCSKYLEHWCIKDADCLEDEDFNLPLNYSIKYLDIDLYVSDFSTIQLINACKNLETLDVSHEITEKLDLLKFERKINILKISIYSSALNTISQIDTAMLFNQVHINASSSIEEFITKDAIDKLKNYKLIYKTYKFYILKLINIDD
jgi:hypothetical protein